MPILHRDEWSLMLDKTSTSRPIVATDRLYQFVLEHGTAGPADWRQKDNGDYTLWESNS